jgi:hypothetical protein
MAKKSRTPRPPKVQAPKTRTSPKPGSRERNTRYMLYSLGGVGAVALAIALIVVTTGGGSGGPSRAEAATAMEAGGCTFKTVNGGEAGHVSDLGAKIKYSTNPPSTGRHFESPAVWDFYTDDAVAPIQAVHNLEHGGIVIWWGEKVPASTVEQLRAFYEDSPVSMLGTPLQGFGNKIGLSAWVKDKSGTNGIVATCTRYDENAFTTFRDAFRGKGPEGIPMEANQPGT